MPKYNWEGVNRLGEPRRGSLEADTEEAVLARLRAEQITPKRVKRAPREINIQFGTGVGTRDILVFTRQLATMIDAGLPLVQCLDILSQQTENQAFAKVLLSVKHSVESGATFSDALRRHPKVFDDLFVNLVQAGEVGGILDTILTRLATYIEKAVKLKRQVKSAMVYPLAILVISIVVIVVMLAYVIPVFEDMYKEFRGAELPGLTQFVLSVSNGFVANWYWFFAAAAALGVGVVAMFRSEKGKNGFDAAILKVPIVGPVMRKVVVARFSRTLGTLLSSGVPILDALDICARTAGNRVVQRSILHARTKISEGKDLAGPLGETGAFPSMVVQMIGVGEQTGAMDQMLQKIADFYEDEVDVAVGALTQLLEPLMMVFLGGIVGFIIIAMYLPVFELAGNIQAE